VNAANKVETSARDEFEAKGWAHLPNFVGADELAGLRDEADRLWADQALFASRGAVPNSPTRSDRLDPVIDVSPPFAAFASDERVLGAMSAILGGPARLFKDKFIVKPPGTGGYGTHQDGAYWQGLGIDMARFLSAFFFLDDSPAEKGTIECAPNLHRTLLTEQNVIADPDDRLLGEFDTINATAGDVLVVHALAPHRSGPNRSNEMRRALVLTYGVDPRPDLYAVYKQFQQEVRS
jgi:phytanoyl-CoA dioxygenase PhyH